MKDSEILKELITLAFESDPGDIKITLSDALDLYGRVLLAGERSGVKSNAKNKDTKAPAEEPAGEQEAPDQSPPVQLHTTGPGKEEKQTIYARLQAYRAAKGLGCYEAVSKAANGVLSADQIREMAAGTPRPLSQWRVLNRALDRLEGTGSGEAV